MAAEMIATLLNQRGHFAKTKFGWPVWTTGRKVVEAELLRENSHTVVVRLDDGNVIKRKKRRDL